MKEDREANDSMGRGTRHISCTKDKRLEDLVQFNYVLLQKVAEEPTKTGA